MVKRKLIGRGLSDGQREAADAVLASPARNRDRGVGLGPRTVHVKAAVADRDVVAAENAHPRHAARNALEQVVLGQSEDDRGGAGDKVMNSAFGLRL